MGNRRMMADTFDMECADPRGFSLALQDRGSLLVTGWPIPDTGGADDEM